MTFSDTRNEPGRAGSNTVGCRRGLAFGWGLAAGIGAAMGVLVGRKALVQAKVGRGHSMKHRALDLAASVMQPKYPRRPRLYRLPGIPRCGRVIR